LDSLGREGAVLRVIDQPLPPDLPSLYHGLLKEAHRRTNPEFRTAMIRLLHWIAYASRPLCLDEVLSLLRLFSDDDGFDIEDVSEIFTKFLQIGDPGSDAEARAQLQSQGGWRTAVKDLVNQDSNNPENIYNDGDLLIKFRERSMISFLQISNDEGDDLRWGTSTAHRQIFLDATRIARRSPDSKATSLDSRLKSYCTLYVTQHFCKIEPEKHTAEENREVMAAIEAILRNKYNFASMAEWASISYEENFSKSFFDRIKHWASLPEAFVTVNLTDKHDLSPQWCMSLKTQPAQCMEGLVRGHTQRFCDSVDLESGLKSYTAATKALEAVSNTSRRNGRAMEGLTRYPREGSTIYLQHARSKSSQTSL
jgi:hypothetical protein